MTKQERYYLDSVLPLFYCIAILQGLAIAEDIGCFVDGECTQSLFVGQWPAADAQECLEICRDYDNCEYFTYHGQDDDVCFGLANCAELETLTCDECYSGSKTCEDLQCWVPGSCIGNTISYETVSKEEDCLERCKETSSCNWFTFDEFDGACILMTECFDVNSNACNTCWSGQVQCGERKDLTRVLVIGGYTDVDSSYFDSVEAIDLSSEPLTCDYVSDYPFPVGNLPAGTILDGLPTVCGGHDDDSGLSTNKCNQYVYEENRWEEMVPGMLAERTFHRSSMVNSATWLLSGGYNRLGITHSSTEVWHNGTFQPGPEMPSPLYGHCQVTLNSSFVAFLGGNNGTNAVPYFYLLDWKSQSWIPMPDISFTIPVKDPCALIENSVNGVELVVLPRYDECHIFNFNNMTWRPGPRIEYDISVTHREITVQMEKNFYIMGGYLEDEDNVTDAIFEFDNENYVWKLDSKRLPTAKRGGVAIAVPDQVIDCV